MKPNMKRLLRQIHYWLSLAVAIPAGIIFFAGILLMLKKEVDWIQPPTAKGVLSQELPAISYQTMLDAAKLHPEAQIKNWSDIDRIDLRVDKGNCQAASQIRLGSPGRYLYWRCAECRLSSLGSHRANP